MIAGCLLKTFSIILLYLFTKPLLLELENKEIFDSEIKIDNNKKLKTINRPFDVIYFCRYLCEKGANLKEWIIRRVEDQNLDKEESRLRVCDMMNEVLPRVIRRFRDVKSETEK